MGRRKKASSWLQIEINTRPRKKRRARSGIRRRKYQTLNARKLNLMLLVILLIFLLVTAQAGQLSVIMGVAFIMVIGFYCIKMALLYRRKKAILHSGIDKIDLMSGEQFERFLEVFFTRKGFKVERTPISGDFGADLILSHNGINTAVQAKRYSDKVGLSAIQEVVGAMAHYSCKAGMVITNNYFTPQAKKLAESNNITLWEREDLIQEIIQLSQTKSREKEDLPPEQEIV